MKIIVIGSGMAGLTAAAALAQAGHAVTIYEQYPAPGGVTAPYEKDGYRWDLGQLLIEGLGPNEPTGHVLDSLGVLDKVRVEVDDRGYVFPTFEVRKPAEYGGVRWRIEQLKQQFPAEAAGLERYWKDYLRFTRLMTLGRRLEGTQGLHGLFGRLKLYNTMLPFLPKKDWSAAQLMNFYFKDEKLKCVFISILADFFTPPSEFIGLGVFALNAEKTFEKRMPVEIAPGAVQLSHYSILGGINTIVEALVERIRALGGQIHTGRAVRQILVEAGHVTGVVDEYGEQAPADVIVASGGAKETFLKLVGDANLPGDFAGQVRGIPLMDSVFMLHLALDFDPRPYVHGAVTYYYGTYDVEGEIKRGQQGEYHEGQAGYVVHVPTLHSPDMAPEGRHAMTIYTICPDTLKEGSWAERKQEYANKLLGYAEQRIPGLQEHSQLLAVITPDEWRLRTHTDHHAFGGISPVLGAWRVPHQTPIQGLWFIGGQSESGGGVNNVVQAAYKTAQKILHAQPPKP
jgi:phytoene dehydrogenase-like protein